MPRRAAEVPHDRRQAWVDQGTTRFLAEVEGLRDEEFARPSRLPDWSRAHVVGHVCLNAEAIGRLVTWATTGVETPMYPDVATRNAEIDELAALEPRRIVDRLHRSCTELDRELRAMPEEAWGATVRTARGREVPAEEILWMRAREVWLHAVDLDSGFGVDDLPEDVLEALVSDVVDAFVARGELGGLRLEASGTDQAWDLGPGTDEPRRVRAPLPLLAAWLTGRAGPDDLRPEDEEPLPAAPRWL